MFKGLPKGQIRTFGILEFSQKNEPTNSFLLLQRICLFAFWENSRTQKSPFEIIWPLAWWVKVIRDVSTGATAATAVTPKFSDTLILFQPGGGGRFCPPLARSHLDFPRGYVPGYCMCVGLSLSICSSPINPNNTPISLSSWLCSVIRSRLLFFFSSRDSWHDVRK